MTRALVVHSGNMYGGVERVLESIARSRGLCPALDVHFALCFEGRLADALREAGASVDLLGRVRVTRPDLVLRARARLADLLHADRPDVVVTQSAWTHALFAPVARRAQLPLVLWVHDRYTGAPCLERLAARHQPDLLVCNSRFSAAAARTTFPDVPAEVVRCPLVLDSPPDTRDEVRRAQGARGDEVVIINVARMEPSKGHQELLSALVRLRADSAPWQCWLVGGAQRPEEVRYEASVREAVAAHGLQGRVRFLGQRQDVLSLVAAADIYCHPGQGAETFGLAIVEALNAGLPVVSTDCGGPGEIVTDACGRLVPVGDTDALADALSMLVTDRGTRQRLGAVGPARARDLCSPGPRLADLRAALEQTLLRAAA